MSNRPPEEFDELQRLLKLKRHEQPPPGYLSHLPNRILLRIQQEELRQESGWWQWFVDRFDAKPMLVCLYGLVVSSLLVLGFQVSQMMQNETLPHATAQTSWLAASPDALTVLPSPFLQSHFANPAGLYNYLSTEPAVPKHQEVGTIRWNPGHGRTSPVSYKE